MERTKWEVITRGDDSFDKPYFEYHIIEYPYGIEAGPQRVCDGLTKKHAHQICQDHNSHDDLLAACEEMAALLNQESLLPMLDLKEVQIIRRGERVIAKAKEVIK